ncbi:hypothetical protein BVX97_03655 [bacterium E08(2017)]|nr:hypothetical protein BVX97_03655 [bacterium E08(2017)]
MRQAERPERKFSFSSILGLNYLGTLVGTLAIALLIFPALGRVYSMAVLSLFNLSVCLYLLPKLGFKKQGLAVCLVAISLVINVGCIVKKHDIDQTYLKTLYYAFDIGEHIKKNPEVFPDGGVRGMVSSVANLIDEFEPVDRTRSIYQEIDIINYPDGSTFLCLDENLQISTFGQLAYHEGFIHMPIAMHHNYPKKVLLLGGGDGFAARELLRYPHVESITQVELDPAMIDLAKNHKWMLEMNKNSFDDERVNLIVDDAFDWVRLNRHLKFDAIYVDFPFPFNYVTLRLYSVELYRNLRKMLSPGGFVAIDSPLSTDVDAKEDDSFYLYNCMIFTTIKAAGFTHPIPYDLETHGFITCSKDDMPMSIEMPYDFPLELSYVNDQMLNEIDELQKFPYEISDKHLNSIFKPTLIYTPKYRYD